MAEDKGRPSIYEKRVETKFYSEESLKLMIEAAAKEKGVSASQYIQKVLEKHLSRIKPK